MLVNSVLGSQLSMHQDVCIVDVHASCQVRPIVPTLMGRFTYNSQLLSDDSLPSILPLQDPVHSKFLVADKVHAYLSFGGVRLEDNVVVTENGIDNLTQVPRTVTEVEAVMAGGSWPPSA